jgi:DNA invertase Pin-like site-specific DNA recombinase
VVSSSPDTHCAFRLVDLQPQQGNPVKASSGDDAGPMGKMVLTVLGMVAEMELGFIKARQRDGIEGEIQRRCLQRAQTND